MNWKEFFKAPFQVADISSTRPSCLVDSEENIILEVNCSSVMLVEPEESILIEVRKQVLKEIADYLNLKEVDEQKIWHEAHVKFHASDNMNEHWAFREGALWVLNYKASDMISKLQEERLELSLKVHEAKKTIENLKTVMVAAAADTTPSPSSPVSVEQFLPPDGEDDWTIGAEQFTRAEVYKLLWTQRAMISNDLKSHCGGILTTEIYEIINNPRTPKF